MGSKTDSEVTKTAERYARRALQRIQQERLRGDPTSDAGPQRIIEEETKAHAAEARRELQERYDKLYRQFQGQEARIRELTAKAIEQLGESDATK